MKIVTFVLIWLTIITGIMWRIVSFLLAGLILGYLCGAFNKKLKTIKVEAGSIAA